MGPRLTAIAAAKSLNMRILYLLPETTSPAGIFSLINDGDGSGKSVGLAAACDHALLLFTSGTTARPKLAPLTHKQLWLSAENMWLSLTA